MVLVKKKSGSKAKISLKIFDFPEEKITVKEKKKNKTLNQMVLKFRIPVTNWASFPYFGRYIYFKSTNYYQKYNVNVPFLISIVNVA